VGAGGEDVAERAELGHRGGDQGRQPGGDRGGERGAERDVRGQDAEQHEIARLHVLDRELVERFTQLGAWGVRRGPAAVIGATSSPR